MKNGELIAIGGIYLDFNAPDFPLGPDGLRLETEVVGNTYIAELGGLCGKFCPAMCQARDTNNFGCATGALKVSQTELPTYDEVSKLIKG